MSLHMWQDELLSGMKEKTKKCSEGVYLLFVKANLQMYLCVWFMSVRMWRTCLVNFSLLHTLTRRHRLDGDTETVLT